MGVFSSGGVGIDLGSANVTICLQEEGIVLREPSLVLCLQDDPDEILASGRDARLMMGRTPKDVALVSPVENAAVAEVQMAATMMKSLAEKALGRRRPLERNRLVVSAYQGMTGVEREALSNAIALVGAKRACYMRAPMAAALGAGVPLADGKGAMVVLIGAASVQVALLSGNGIAAARSIRIGSDRLDEAIVRMVRRDKGLIIGRRTAEDLKIDIGSALEAAGDKNEEVLLRGRDAATGKPSTVSVSINDIVNAMKGVVEDIVEAIREAFENAPAELATDVLSKGVYLCGGGAQLDGLRTRLGEMLGLPVIISDHPQDDVALGLCMAASDDRLAARLAQSACLTEI